MKRLTAILCSFCIFVSVLSGCNGKKTDRSFPEEETSTVVVSEATNEAADQSGSDIEETETSRFNLSESPELIEYLSVDPNRARAVKLAGQHGLTEEDLNGQYTLFLKFSNTIEGNSGLGDYREYVYRIFPKVAKRVDYLQEGYFFYMLSTLRIQVADIDKTYAGLYDLTNVILISEYYLKEREWCLPYVIFHELMHFLDWSINGLRDFAYVSDKEHFRSREYWSQPEEKRFEADYCERTDFLTEAGAEYFATKYYTGASISYTDGVVFLAGIEYIMGEEYLEQLFFSWDTDAIFKELFFGTSYMGSKYMTGLELLDYITRVYRYEEEREFTFSACDILIDLYGCYKDGDWKEDKQFLAILRNLLGIDQKKWKNSKYADFIETIVFQSEAQFKKYKKAHVKGIPEKPKFDPDYPRIFMRDGKIYEGVLADFTDPVTGEKYTASITYEWDYENDELIGYEINRMKPISYGLAAPMASS